MNRSYRIGLGIVVGVVALSLAACLASVDTRASVPPAGQDLGRDALPLGEFRLTDQTGSVVTDRSLADRAWIGAFIFTRCPSSCPRISAVMKGLQGKLDPTTTLVSISVDPEHDTPEVLFRYAKGLESEPSRWLFLTGSKDDVYRLILDRFKVPVAETSEIDRKAGAEAVSHSSRLVLVAPGNRVLGYFDSTDPKAVEALIKTAKRIDPGSRSPLPSVNAALNGSCAVLLMLAWNAIRFGRWRLHAGLMVAALAVSAVFLGCYLVYHYQVGSVPFRGVGPIRLAYFTILLSHTVLAVVMLPLVIAAVVQALRKRWDRHARIAVIAYPIWLYVSITGVVVYWLLYQVDAPVSLG